MHPSRYVCEAYLEVAYRSRTRQAKERRGGCVVNINEEEVRVARPEESEGAEPR